MGVNCLIQIGNSDDRLSQGEWSRFIAEMRDLFRPSGFQVHGEWFSGPDQPWQNANWTVEVLPPAWWRAAGPDGLKNTTTASMAPAEAMRDRDMQAARDQLKERVKRLCYLWRQDSFAWTEAPVELVKTGWPRAIPKDVQKAQEEGWAPIPGTAKDSTSPAPASTGEADQDA